jgi:hypothetical protein
MNKFVFVAVSVSAILLLALGIILLNPSSPTNPFFVGVTYSGNSTDEAKLLIDKVKDYSNLFVLQSGSLQEFPDKINEVGDYSISSGMYFVVYFGSSRWTYLNNWLETYEEKWGSHFLGVYYGDEPGGKMLDGNTDFWDESTKSLIMKHPDGHISGYPLAEDTKVDYWPDGIIILRIEEAVRVRTFVYYYPNGTITAERTEYGTTIKIEDYEVTYTYEELWNTRPFQTYAETAERFIKQHNSNLINGPKNDTDITAFTSDYTLYWYDYKAGYDVVLAQFGWNHTLAQDIALVRGAAELQNKKWGAIITWKYNHPPYLDSGEAIYNQMRTAYEAGAEYIMVFNYAGDIEGPDGTLQDEHFLALERFWNEVVQSPEVEHGSIESEAVLVLPENYGWGMRNPKDKIWGLWDADEKSEQIWELRSYLLQEYGFTLDIVYDDVEYPIINSNYKQIYYWNQTI